MRRSLLSILFFGFTAMTLSCGGGDGGEDTKTPDTATDQVSTDSSSDTGADQSTTPDVSTPDTATDVPACVPLCDNKECGPDGCGGICGICMGDDVCSLEGSCVPNQTVSADPEVCTGDVIGALQDFGGACCYTSVSHPNNPNCVWYDPTYIETDGACIDNECGGGFCSSSTYCTKTCNIYQDNMDNATGEAAPQGDGINDEGAIEECAGAADGPVGPDYKCVNLRPIVQQPYGVCRPGTNFRPCENNADCSEGEACKALYMRGVVEPRCQPYEKGSLDGMEECNSDPNSGPITHCKGAFCFGSGCIDMCVDGDDCATDTCEDGFCSKNPERACTTSSECSAWECGPVTPYTDTDYTDDMCKVRACEAGGDCVDPDWFCRPFWNGADVVEEVGFAPACRRKEAEAVGYGEACGVDGDGTDLPPCAWSSGCIDNYCAGPCDSDEDCNDGAECRHAMEWSIDVDDDDEIDTYVNVELCQTWEHTGDLLECITDAECGEGQHCQYRLESEGEGEEKMWKVAFKCKTTLDNDQDFGAVCGGSSGNECKSDLCLVPTGTTGIDSMCSSYCTQKTDCPDTVEFDGTSWKTLCLSFRASHQDNNDPTDDVYVPYCWRTSPIGSLDPCDEERKCSGNLEYCRAVSVARNADEPVLVEHLCADNSEGLTELPTKEIGAACDSWTECKGRACYSDSQGNGYCTELCGTDAGCANGAGLDLKCTDVVLVERADPANSGVTSRCILQEQCAQCSSNDDCGGSFVCVNIGGLGALADQRCGAPCSSDDDCTNPGDSCKENISPTGILTGDMACLPTSCAP